MIILDVLEHLNDPQKLIDDCYGFLKPGGVIHAFIPCEAHSVYWLGEKVFGFHTKERTVGHIQRFTRRTAENLFNRSFIIMKRKYSFHLLGSSLDYLLFSALLNKKFSSIPFIMITANIDTETKFRQLEHGVHDFITKPFKVKELILKIKNILSLAENIEKKFSPDPFSKITIKLSNKDFIESVNEILLKNIKSKINVVELASELHISKSTLDKRIRKHTNKNISQYIREFKIDYAIKLINLGEKNIQFLSDETGFRSLSYFSISFKSYLNVSPSDYVKSVSVDK